MAYTIKGWAKANDCESFDTIGLASLWDYWYICNCGGRKSILSDYKSLRKADRKEMMQFLKQNGFIKLFDFIYEHCD